jgi:hypothetical protein
MGHAHLAVRSRTGDRDEAARLHLGHRVPPGQRRELTERQGLAQGEELQHPPLLRGEVVCAGADDLDQ